MPRAACSSEEGEELAEARLQASGVIQELGARFEQALEETGLLKDKPFLRVNPEALHAVCRAARDAGFDYLACITAVDYPGGGYLEVVYNLYSYGRREHLVLKVRCPRDEPVLPSVADIWRAALFLEREAYDLLGVRFRGHPDLKRILLPEPWSGHPLRKDYDMAREQFVRKGPQGEDVVGFDPTEGW